MNRTIQLPMKRIKKISRWVRLCCLFLTVFCLLIMLAIIIPLWSGFGEGKIVGDGVISYKIGWIFRGNGIPFSDFSFSAKLFLSLYTFILLGLPVKALYHLSKLFRFYANGKIFTAKDNGQLKQFGIICLILTCSAPLWVLLRHLYVSSLKGEISIAAVAIKDFYEILPIVTILGVFSATVLCISWVMERGMEMRENQELTI